MGGRYVTNEPVLFTLDTIQWIVTALVQLSLSLPLSFWRRRENTKLCGVFVGHDYREIHKMFETENPNEVLNFLQNSRQFERASFDP